MTEFKPGDRVRIVEIDSETRQPRDNGTVFEAELTRVGKTYVRAKTREPEFARPTTFYPESNWTVWFADGSGWRLLPVTGEEAGTSAGEGQ